MPRQKVPRRFQRGQANVTTDTTHISYVCVRNTPNNVERTLHTRPSFNWRPVNPFRTAVPFWGQTI